MFDVNPNPRGQFLSMNVTLNDSRIDPDLAIEAASFFGLKKDEAAEEAKHILSVVGHSWRPIAESYGISRDSQEAMEPAYLFREVIIHMGQSSLNGTLESHESQAATACAFDSSLRL